jgi:hypothetical protein
MAPPLPARRHLAALLVAVAATTSVVAGCSSGDGSDGGTTPTGKDPAKQALVTAANEVCRDGRAARAKVPSPKPEGGDQALEAFAKAQATELDRSAEALAAIEATGDPKDQLDALVAAYRDAADTLRTKGAAVLGEKNFLSDQDLFDYGFTECVAPVKDATVTTTTAKG